MKKTINKTLSWVLSVAMLFSVFMFGNIADVNVNATNITVYSQTDSRWGSHQYGYSNTAGTQKATISSGGCGILAYVNAVYYLNGQFIQPVTLADWSVSHGYRVNGVGTSLGLYKAFADACGSQYGIKYSGETNSYDTLRNHLNNGGVAVGSAPDHLMAIVDYDNSNGKFLILDSYKSSNRHTYSNGYTWETESSIKSTEKLKFSTFRLLSSMGFVSCGCSESYAGNYVVKTSGTNLNIRSSHSTSGSVIGSIPNGTTVYVSKGNGTWAHVTYGGKSGYCSMQYLTLANPKPSASYISVAAGTHYTPTSLWWDKTDNTDYYDVKIWKGTYWQGDVYRGVWGVKDTSCIVDLPEGYYEAYVDSVNSNGCTMSRNVVKFNVGAGQKVDLGNDFYAYIIRNYNWAHLSDVDNDARIKNDGNNVWHFTKTNDGGYKSDILPHL